MNAWSHLPNAVHIERVLGSVRANPEKWYAARNAARNAAWYAARNAARNAAWYAARYAAWYAARNAAWDAAWYAARNAARNAAWYAARDAAWYAARGAILALIVWDDCAHLLDSEPEHVKLLAALGVESAILLYPACIVFSKEKELA